MQEKQYIIAMDQGTTSSRAIVFDRRGTILAVAQREFRQIYPKPGWVEHDPMEIWSTQMGVTMEAMQKIDARPEEIAAIGITNQRETTLLWEAKTGKPVYNAIVWQCRRTAPMIDRLKAEGWTETIRQKTGLVPDAYFSASKLAWLLDNVPGLRERAERGELRFGTVDTWLIWNLTEGRVHATDYTNASRTMLFDIHRLCWDEELLDIFRIPRSLLPTVQPSGARYGSTTRLGGEIPIAGVAGDQQAALFGQCCWAPGDVKCTYGTGCFMLMNTGSAPVLSRNGLLTTLAATAGEKPAYALEGSVFIAGAAIQWLRDEMHLVSTAAETEALCQTVPDAAGIYIVPAFAGLGAPYWQPYARGAVVGLTRGVSREHFIRATVESLAYQTEDLLSAMKEESGLALSVLKVDGGASANNFLMQFQSDISAATIQRPLCIETTALGAAQLAGLTVGYWKSLEEIKTNWRCASTFTPRLPEAKRTRLLHGWQRAVQCALLWAEEGEE